MCFSRAVFNGVFPPYDDWETKMENVTSYHNSDRGDKKQNIRTFICGVFLLWKRFNSRWLYGQNMFLKHQPRFFPSLYTLPVSNSLTSLFAEVPVRAVGDSELGSNGSVTGSTSSFLMSETMKNCEVTLGGKLYHIMNVFRKLLLRLRQEVKREYRVSPHNAEESWDPRSRQKGHQHHKEAEPNKCRLQHRNGNAQG